VLEFFLSWFKNLKVIKRGMGMRKFLILICEVVLAFAGIAASQGEVLVVSPVQATSIATCKVGSAENAYGVLSFKIKRDRLRIREVYKVPIFSVLRRGASTKSRAVRFVEVKGKGVVIDYATYPVEIRIFSYKKPDDYVLINGKKHYIKGIKWEGSATEAIFIENFTVRRIVGKIMSVRATNEYLIMRVASPLTFSATTTAMDEPYFKYLNKSILYTIFLKALLWFKNLTGSFGIAIIILTFILRSVLLRPLNWKQFDAMRKLQEMQPVLKSIQEKYKDNPQEMQKQMAMVYSRYGVNPFSGCLPALIQIPILIVMFGILKTSAEIKGYAFLWMKDLGEADSTGIMPLLVALSMYFQPGQQNQQGAMGIVMPVFMFLIAKMLPAGVLVYWISSSIFGYIDQMIWTGKLNLSFLKSSKGSNNQ